MIASSSAYKITWEKLPEDFILPDDPVDNIHQPALAAALTESLDQAGKLPEKALTPTNYGICATVNGKMVVKAPDWAYIPQISVERPEVIRSYTPNLQGDLPVVVLEFLSDTDGGEYSTKATYPPGKYFYYEQILQVPNYGIFDPKTGELELYRLGNQQRYDRQSPNPDGRFWIPEMGLYLGVWQGSRENLESYWLRWWDEQGNLLLWGKEKVEQERSRAETERQQAETERQRADAEQQRADRLAAQLRAAGIEINE
ncbi:Uma2 family endonuclease [Roseofilum capinflatum]|uniref:Uma2 family endonuclease n=1 Tax=Roseofilum capinflatum BLCC-M114 TaxID=3022440 RepID=A0ABT7B943_9CYAN|nr:Uma2 family endonuclease [Roseofilum capinflatum]MDJ1175026.1 Uma2 family endonuclease [Roseofilum capinflatum BLCC-M114]